MKHSALFLGLMILSLAGKSQYNESLIIEPLLKTDTTVLGQRFILPDIQNFEATILKITFLPGKSTGWHKHPYPVFGYVLKGTLTAEQEDGRTLIFTENTCFSEAIGTFHNGTNNGKEDLVLVVFYMGEKNKPLSLKKSNITQ